MTKISTTTIVITLVNIIFIIWCFQVPGLKGGVLISCYATSYCLAIMGLTIATEDISKAYKYPILIINTLIIISPALLVAWGLYVAIYLGGV